jgi:hypothetical protein
VARIRTTLDRPDHGRSCYQAGCDCEVGRKANSDYLKAYRARKRAEKLAAAGVEASEAPPVVVPASEPEPEPASPGPIESALADDLEREDGEPRFLKAVALTVARSLDGAVRTYRHDLVSPLAQRLVDVGKLLFPPSPGDPGESEDDKRAKVLQLIAGGGQGAETPGASGGA